MKPAALRASIAATALVSAASIGVAVYLAWPRAAPAPAMAAGDMGVLAERLAKRLQTRDPGDGEGWALLARSYVSLGRNDEAVAAFERARLLLGDSDVQLAADYHAAKNAGGAALRPAPASSALPAR